MTQALHHRMPLRRRVLVGMTVTVASLCASVGPMAVNGVATAAPAPAATSVAGQLHGLKEVTYMPSDAGWSQMWSDWQPSRVNSDLARISSLGANTVRAIVQPFTFGWHTPTPTMQARFDQFVSMAQSHGLRVQVTLFDQFGNYDQIAQSETFASALLGKYRNSPAISFVEVQNEVDPRNGAVVRWLRALMPAVKSVVGTIPVTVSTPGIDGVAGLRALKVALRGTAPDFYDFHYYGTTGAALTTLAAVEAAAAPSPLYIGEAGLSTDDPSFNLDSEASQAQFYASVEGATHDLGLPAAAVWTLNDFQRSALPTSLPDREMYFGLYRTDGTPKPAAAVVKAAFTSPAATSAAVFNANLETVSRGLPAGWAPVHHTAAKLRVVGAGPARGTGAVSISNARSAIAAQPAWTTVLNTGAITSGMPLRATVWAKGAAATGRSVAAIAWFTPGGTYLGNASSASVRSGTTGWSQLSVSSTAPAGAAYAELSLQSYDNSGTVWFGGANVVRH